MDIVAVATVAMDIIMQVDRLPGEDGFAVVQKTSLVDGGSGANVIVQASKMGGECGFIAKLGDDEIGDKFQHGLRREKVDFSCMRIKEGGTSLHTQIVGIPLVTLGSEGSTTVYKDKKVNSCQGDGSD